jgi:tetratricopeptide (TPR) repeat protein
MKLYVLLFGSPEQEADNMLRKGAHGETIMLFHLWHVWRRSPQEWELKRLITTGFKGFGYSPVQEVAAAKAWLAAWELFKAMLTPDIRAMPAFYTAHPKVRIDLEQWLMHLDMLLHNIGLEAAHYHAERLRVSREYQHLFPEMDADTRVHITRAEAEALWALGRQPEAEAVYHQLVVTLSDQARGYIGWADHYVLFGDRAHKYARAEALLKQALSRPYLDDRPSVLERLINLYDAWDRPQDIPPLEQELRALREPPGRRESRDA